MEFGGVATLTRFQDGIKPYAWNMDVVLDASLKEGPRNLEIAQQNYLWQLDAPGLFHGLLRLMPTLSYTHTVNLGWFGLGNASPGTRPGDGNPERYFQFIQSEARVRQIARINLPGPIDGVILTSLRYLDPADYPNSKLELDAAAVSPNGTPLIRGLRKLGQAAVGIGAIYDTRDNEFFTTRGAYHQVGVKFSEGVPFGADIRYGEASAILAGYLQFYAPFIFAWRLVADLEFGNVPFYDLFTGGPFTTIEMPGGSAGIRGVPIGRYSGPIKALANVEVRGMLLDVKAFGQKFHIGGTTFFDTGRIWADYSFNSPADGTGLGLKYGVGVGGYLQWGQAAVFRIEMAYSPDAASENPGFPFGLYVEDGLMF